MKVKEVKVKLDASTWRWLRAYAKANSHMQLTPHKVRPEELLKHAAFCLADAAGRHHGSRGDVGQNLLLCCGFQEQIPAETIKRLRAQDGRAK